MKNSIEILKELKDKKLFNLNSLKNWKSEELDEMLASYLEAKKIAEEGDDSLTRMVLEEKISQVIQAKNLKSSPSIQAVL
jgi:hypothetical protein